MFHESIASKIIKIAIIAVATKSMQINANDDLDPNLERQSSLRTANLKITVYRDRRNPRIVLEDVKHKSTPPLKQGERDQADLERRILEAGPGYRTMFNQCIGISKSYLLELARQIWSSQIARNPFARGPDRLCHRSKQALVCYFCKHAPDLQLPPDAPRDAPRDDTLKLPDDLGWPLPSDLESFS
jgi:hypothetical protein